MIIQEVVLTQISWLKSRTLTDAVLYIVLDKAFTQLMNHFTYGYNRSLTDLKYLTTTATKSEQ